MFLGVSSASGRLLFGRLCDVKSINPRYVSQLSIALAGVATLLLPLARSYFAVACYTATFGFFDGAFMVSHSVILLDIVGPDRRAAAFGFGSMLFSFSVASGPPLAGERMSGGCTRWTLGLGDATHALGTPTPIVFNPIHTGRFFGLLLPGVDDSAVPHPRNSENIKAMTMSLWIVVAQTP